MKQLLDGMPNEMHAHACTHTHTQRMPKQLSVMQRSVCVCWVGGDCSTSLLIRMPLLRLWGLSFVASSLVLCLDSPDSLIWFSFVQLPHGARSPRSLRGNAAEQQFDVSGIWVSFILKLASGLSRG